MSHYDLIIIGSGPAGRSAAIQAGKLKRRVLVIDLKDRFGGVSVHTGTIPSKTLRETVLNLSGWRERSFYGRAYRAKDDIAAEDLKARLHMTLDYEVDVLEHQFNRNHVDTLNGFARFVGPNEIEVATEAGQVRRLSADKFLIATGTVTFRPDYVPFNGRTVVDSDEFLELGQIPRILVVIGAGVIGVEYATIFSALDVHVTLIEPRDTMLDFIDRELMEDFTYQLRDRGMAMRFGKKVDKVERAEGGVTISLEGGRKVRSGMLLFAAGRMGATQALNLSACGLDSDHRGRLKIDPETLQTSVPHIYAAGDVIGFPSLASTSMEQGRIAACHALGAPAHDPPEFFPYGIYSVPEMSTVGMTEEEAAHDLAHVEIYRAEFRPMRHTLSGRNEKMIMKLVVDGDTRKVLGAHILGPDAGELAQALAIALKAGCSKDDFDRTMAVHPTAAEELVTMYQPSYVFRNGERAG